MTHASAPRAAHCRSTTLAILAIAFLAGGSCGLESTTLARGSPQLVGKRSNRTFSQMQNQRGMTWPATGVRRKVARRRLTITSSRRQRAYARPMGTLRSKSCRGFPIPIV